MEENIKIKKLKEFRKQLDTLNTKITRNGTMLFLNILLIIFSLNIKQEQDNETLKYILSILGTGLSTYYLKKMIENISKKTNIETLIELLEIEKQTKKLTNKK